jgi:hypothetical protein
MSKLKPNRLIIQLLLSCAVDWRIDKDIRIANLQDGLQRCQIIDRVQHLFCSGRRQRKRSIHRRGKRNRRRKIGVLVERGGRANRIVLRQQSGQTERNLSHASATQTGEIRLSTKNVGSIREVAKIVRYYSREIYTWEQRTKGTDLVRRDSQISFLFAKVQVV